MLQILPLPTIVQAVRGSHDIVCYRVQVPSAYSALRCIALHCISLTRIGLTALACVGCRIQHPSHPSILRFTKYVA